MPRADPLRGQTGEAMTSGDADRIIIDIELPRICAWCPNPIPPTMRADAECCSTRCRQARHRFKRAVGGPAVAQASTTTPLRLAYADPPYPGKSRRYYAGHPDFAGEVDHPALIRRLSIEFDGWALSTSAEALPDVLASCPPGARVGAWFRGERPTRSARPLNAWEPVIYFGGRAYVSPVDERRLDALVHISRPRLTDAHRVVGAKPAKFAGWLFGLLGALPVDDFTDVFPGSGGVARAWAHYCEASSPPAGSTDSSRVAADDGTAAAEPSRGSELRVAVRPGDGSRCAGTARRVQV